MWGYDGAPDWATITDGAPRCQFQGRDISPAGNRAFQHFYFDTDGVQSAFIETWGGSRPNSPTSPPSRATTCSTSPLRRDGARHHLAACSAASTTGRSRRSAPRRSPDRLRRAQHPLVGPRLRHGPTPGFTDDANIVFSPHLYAESITMDRSLGLPPIVGSTASSTSRNGSPRIRRSALVGRVRLLGRGRRLVDRLTRYAAEDAELLGSAYWVWKQACGDPQNGIGPFGDALMLQDCETGDDAPPRDDLLRILTRAYPHSAPGVSPRSKPTALRRARRHRPGAQLRTRGVGPR